VKTLLDEPFGALDAFTLEGKPGAGSVAMPR